MLTKLTENTYISIDCIAALEEHHGTTTIHLAGGKSVSVKMPMQEILDIVKRYYAN